METEKRASLGKRRLGGRKKVQQAPAGGPGNSGPAAPGRAAKRLALAALVLVALGLGGWAGLRALFPQERLLALLEPRLEAALGRPVEIGAAQLHAFPISVRLRDVRLPPVATSGTPDSLPPLEIDMLAGTLKLWPLLGRRVVVEALELDRPRLRFSQSKEGTWENWTSKGNQPATGSSTTGGAASLQIDRLLIQDGRLWFRSAAQDIALEMPLAAELRLQADRDLRQVSLRGWIESAALQGGGKLQELRDLHVRLEPEIEVNVPDSTATVDRLVLRIQNLSLELVGSAALVGGKPELALSTRSEDINLAELLSIVPRRLAPMLDRFAASGNARLDLKINLPAAGEPLVLGTLGVDGGQLRAPEVPERIENIRLQAVFDRDVFKLEQLSAQVAESPVSIRGQVTSPFKPEATSFALDLQAGVDVQRAARLAELPPDLRLSGRVDATLHVEGTPRAPQDASIHGPIELVGVRVETPELVQPLLVDAQLQGVGSGVRWSGGRLRLGDADVRVDGEIHELLSDARRITLDASTDTVDLDALLPKKSSATPGGAKDAAKSLVPPAPPLPVTATLAIGNARVAEASVRDAHVEYSGDPSGFQLHLDAAALEREALVLHALRGVLRGSDRQAHGTLQARDGKLKKLQARELQSRVDVEGTRVRLDSLVAQAYDGRLHGGLVVDLADTASPTYELKVDIDNVEVGAMSQALIPSGNLVTGRVNGTSRWSGRAGEPAVVRNSLSADGRGIAVQGRLREVPLLNVMSAFLRLPSLADFSYRDLGFMFEVKDGRVRVPELKAEGASGSLLAAGSVGLDGSVDVDLNVTLSETLSRRYLDGAPAAQRLFASPDGRIVLDFDVSGSLKSPSIKPNLEATAARGLRSLVPSEIGRLLEGVVPRPVATPDSQVTRVEDTVRQVGDQIRSGIGGLLGRKKAPADSTRKP